MVNSPENTFLMILTLAYTDALYIFMLYIYTCTRRHKFKHLLDVSAFGWSNVHWNATGWPNVHWNWGTERILAGYTGIWLVKTLVETAHTGMPLGNLWQLQPTLKHNLRDCNSPSVPPPPPPPPPHPPHPYFYPPPLLLPPTPTTTTTTTTPPPRTHTGTYS